MLGCDSPLAHAQVGRADKTSDGGAVCFQDCPQDLSRESMKYSKYYAQERHCPVSYTHLTLPTSCCV